MKILVNGEPRETPPDATILDLLRQLNLEDRRVAVMIQGEIVRRADHPQRRLDEGDSVEIINMVGGG